MFKRLIEIFAIALCAVSVMAGGYSDEMVVSVATNAAATATGSAKTNDYPLFGCVDQLELIFSRNATCDVDVVVIHGGLGAASQSETTLYSANDVGTADLLLFPRFDTHTTAGASNTNDDPVPYILYNDKLALRAYSAGVTNALTVRLRAKLR